MYLYGEKLHSYCNGIVKTGDASAPLLPMPTAIAMKTSEPVIFSSTS